MTAGVGIGARRRAQESQAELYVSQLQPPRSAAAAHLARIRIVICIVIVILILIRIFILIISFVIIVIVVIVSFSLIVSFSVVCGCENAALVSTRAGATAINSVFIFDCCC
jgi:hypothetical protein